MMGGVAEDGRVEAEAVRKCPTPLAFVGGMFFAAILIGIAAVIARGPAAFPARVGELGDVKLVATTGPNPSYQPCPPPLKELGRIAIVVEGDEAFAVHDVAGQAAELSDRLGCRIELRYRGKRMVAYPGRKVESIVDGYTRGLEIEAEVKGLR